MRIGKVGMDRRTFSVTAERSRQGVGRPQQPSRLLQRVRVVAHGVGPGNHGQPARMIRADMTQLVRRVVQQTVAERPVRSVSLKR